VAAQEGGDYEPLEKLFEETKKEGFFADLKNAVGKKEPIIFGEYAFDNPPNSKADRFTCTERVFKVYPRLFAMGVAKEGVIAPPKWNSLVLSNKGRTQLLGSTAKAAKVSFIGGGAASALGVVLGVISSLIAPKAPKAAPTKPAIVGAPAPKAIQNDFPAEQIQRNARPHHKRSHRSRP
jgi:hypothetical protein